MRRCPDASSSNASGCEGGTGGGCKEWLTGAYCKLCNSSARGVRYYDTETSTCRPCAEASWLLPAALVTILCVLPALLWIHCRGGLGRLQRLRTAIMQRYVVRLSLQPKIKLLVSFYQTLSRVPSVYLVVLPTNVVELLRSFKLVSLGLDGVPLE